MAQKDSSLASAWRIFFAGCVRSGLPSSDAHLTSRPHQHLARKHHALVGRESLEHHYVVTLTLAQLDWTKLGRVVRFDYVDKRSLLAHLGGLTRNQHRRLFHRQ